MMKALAVVFYEGLVDDHSIAGSFAALQRVVAASRIILFPAVVSKYKRLRILDKLRNPPRRWDPLYFLVYKYYLCRDLSFRDRLQCAINHYEHEANNYNDKYFQRIRTPNGITLWDWVMDSVRFALILATTDFNRQEGELSVSLYADNVRLCMMSFCYVDANMFGLRARSTMLISRNQTDTAAPGSRMKFDQRFKGAPPQFFCLFAICGIAMSNGFKTILGIKHDLQIAYDTNYELGFRHSYSDLWERFGGVNIDERIYLLEAPPKLSPLALVNPTHRRRALYRRRIWHEIAQSACAALDRYRLSPRQFGPLAPRSFSERDPRADCRRAAAGAGMGRADAPIRTQPPA